MIERDSVLLSAADLAVDYHTAEGPVRALDSASLDVRVGDVMAVVGESGSGKSTLGLAAGRLLPANAARVGGDLKVLGGSIFDLPESQVRALRHDVLGFIFQNPVAALDPTLRIKRQLELAAPGTDETALLEALTDVGLTDGPRVLRSYPHELSGGMAQRVAIAMALLRRPRLVIADEPTAAVDASRRTQILEILVGRSQEQGSALLLLTHDLHVVRRWCTQIAVMYGGRVVESGPTTEVLTHPSHPYTAALLSALPGDERPHERLSAIPGAPPVLHGPSPGCAFAPRCSHRLEWCDAIRPAALEVAAGRTVCCHLATDALVDLSHSPNGPERAQAHLPEAMGS
jgi:oligopeptide/dipeptide ABC transporter ATP-binding protein